MNTPSQLNVLTMLLIGLGQSGGGSGPDSGMSVQETTGSLIAPCSGTDMGGRTTFGRIVFAPGGRSLFAQVRYPCPADDPIQRSSKIVEIGVPSGKPVRTLFDRPSHARRLAPLALASDGLSLIANNHDDRELVYLSIADGRIVKTVAYADQADVEPAGVLGVLPDRQTAWIKHTVGLERSTEVARISLADGRELSRIRLGPKPRCGRSIRLIRGAEPTLLEIRGSSRLSPRELVLRDILPPEVGAARSLRIPAPFGAKLVCSRDGETLTMESKEPPGFLVWDLSEDTEKLFVPVPEGRRVVWQLAYDETNGRLYIPTLAPNAASTPDCRTGFSVCVVDLRSGTWLAELTYPDDVLPGQPHALRISPDGTKLCTACSKANRIDGTSAGSTLVMWDVSTLGGVELTRDAILAIAKRELESRDSWGSTELEWEVKRTPDGWWVTVYRLPRAPGGFRTIRLSETGGVLGYHRGR